MQHNQFSAHSRKKQTKSIVCVWPFNKILFRLVLLGGGDREWGENEMTLHFLPLPFYLLYSSSIIKKDHCSVFETAASMTCLVKYLSNNVNIVSAQLTMLTFHSNHDCSNIKRNASYSLHSFSSITLEKQPSNNFYAVVCKLNIKIIFNSYLFLCI